MTRPMSEVLGIILAKAELSSSLLVGLDDAHRYGDISRVEHSCADRMIVKWIAGFDCSGYQNFSAKKQSFKHFIKECKANESVRAG